METTSAYRKVSSTSVDPLLVNQCVERYMGPLERIFARTRIGRLLLEDRAITPGQLREALLIQKKERKFLGEILVRLGTMKKEETDKVLRLQEAQRLQSLNRFQQRKLRLGQILLKNQAITTKWLKEALKKQKKTRKPLGETLVEMNVISRGTLETYLSMQENVRKFVLIFSLAFLLMGCVSGMNATRTGYTKMSSKHKSFTGTNYIERKPYYRKGQDKKGYDYQGKPAPVTPFEFKYKRVREYLRTAHGFRYKADKKGADYWQLPDETERKGGGDCEDKAIWLYSRLLKDGFEDIRLVIGKVREDSLRFHSWVAWYPQGKVYVLDPTNDSEMWEIDEYPKGFYKPYYSFYRDKSWRHS